MSKFQVAEGRQKQASDEAIYYTITTTNWASSPVVSSVKAYEMATETEVTSTVLNGSSSVDGDVITLPIVYCLTEDELYRVEVIFTSNAATYYCYIIIRCI